MFWLSEQTRVFLRTGVTDGRLGIDALRGLVSKAMRLDVLTGALIVFCNGQTQPRALPALGWERVLARDQAGGTGDIRLAAGRGAGAAKASHGVLV